MNNQNLSATPISGGKFGGSWESVRREERIGKTGGRIAKIGGRREERIVKTGGRRDII